MGVELFDFDEAEASTGWLELPRSNHDIDPNVAPRSEAHEYGVSSLHFAASDRPFHPDRLWAALEPLVDGTAPAPTAPAAAAMNGVDGKDASNTDDSGAGRAGFGKLLRSKGVVWLASRSHVMGDWSQAGDDVHFDFGGEWPDHAKADGITTTTALAAAASDSSTSASSTLSSLTRSSEANGQNEKEAAPARSSLVLIGQDLAWPACEAALQGALLTDEEMAMGPARWAELDDPFPPWEIPE